MHVGNLYMVYVSILKSTSFYHVSNARGCCDKVVATWPSPRGKIANKSYSRGMGLNWSRLIACSTVGCSSGVCTEAFSPGAARGGKLHHRHNVDISVCALLTNHTQQLYRMMSSCIYAMAERRLKQLMHLLSRGQPGHLAHAVKLCLPNDRRASLSPTCAVKQGLLLL